MSLTTSGIQRLVQQAGREADLPIQKLNRTYLKIEKPTFRSTAGRPAVCHP
jgi:hypothetical protein